VRGSSSYLRNFYNHNAITSSTIRVLGPGGDDRALDHYFAPVLIGLPPRSRLHFIPGQLDLLFRERAGRYLQCRALDHEFTVTTSRGKKTKPLSPMLLPYEFWATRCCTPSMRHQSMKR
jgi:hypothetical protein